jgi:hypothetical protein
LERLGKFQIVVQQIGSPVQGGKMRKMLVILVILTMSLAIVEELPGPGITPDNWLYF